MSLPAVLVLGGHGYIGSALVTYLTDRGFPLQSVDLGLRGNPGRLPGLKAPYQELTARDLEAFDSVVLLAGHSSVAACDRSPVEAFGNNVAAFAGLVHKLKKQKLIYASSISIYIDTQGRLASEEDDLPEAVSYYDCHKQLIERYAEVAYPNSYGLRFGTVSGPSPNLRPELLLNSMVLSALEQGCVRVANRNAHRPLLGINDLVRAVEAVLIGDVPPGRYNLASLDCTIGEVADQVARRFSVPCIEVDLPNNYDVRVDTSRFLSASGLTFKDNLAGLLEALSDHYLSQCRSQPGEPPHGS
jgi:nucleoside-diphosphate-sugar epimerase